MPAVSVIMVFHRDAPFLRPAVASILAQSFRDFELLLVDNGTGLTADALGSAGRDPRLRWVRLPRNEGIPGGHNAGLAAASGELVALQDYDDLAMPDRFERQVAALRGDAALGLVSGRAERIDEHDRVTGEVFCLDRPEEHARYAPYAAPLITPAAMGRREAFAALPYRTEFPFAADLDFQSRVVERWRTAVLPQVVLRYRWYREQTTQQRQAAIEHSRCVINLIASRRRRSRSEDLAATLTATAAPSIAESWRRGAALALADGLGLAAAFQARRSLVHDRTATGAWRAFRLAGAAARIDRHAGHRAVWSMFLRGPVRALGLHPAGKNNAAPASA